MSSRIRSLFRDPLPGAFLAILLLVVIFCVPFLARATSNPPVAAAPQETIVNITDDGFTPELTTIRADEQVTWVNQTGQTLVLSEGEPRGPYVLYLPIILRSGSTAANPTALNAPGSQNPASPTTPAGLFSETLAPGERFSFVFSKPAVYRIYVFGVPAWIGKITVLRPVGGQVRGLLYTDLRNFDDAHLTDLYQIFVPNVEVSLTHQVTGDSETVITDLSGRFSFSHHPAGKYDLCWKAPGFLAACLQGGVTLTNGNVPLGHIPISLMRDDNYGAVYGKVYLQDNSLPRFFSSMANVNVYAHVLLLDETGAEQSMVYVNNYGHYIIPQVPIQKKVSVQAVLEKEESTRGIAAGVLGGLTAHRLDIPFLNSRPIFENPLVPYQAGESVQIVPPGATVNIVADASDPDGDALAFQWVLPAGMGSLSSDTGSSVQWMLPAVQQSNQIEVIAYDERGGYNRATLLLETNGDGVLFSGNIVTPVGAPVPTADITINGHATTSNNQGHFYIRVPQAEQYLFNVQKMGYALLSRVYVMGQAGSTWTLTPATVVSNVDPNNPIDIRDDNRICVGPLSARFDWDEYPNQATPRYQDTNGDLIRVGEHALYFEELIFGTGYSVGDSFNEAGETVDVLPFFFSDGTQYDDGSLRVGNTGQAGGSGNELVVINVNVGVEPQERHQRVDIRFGEFGGNVNLMVNGEMANVQDFAELHGDTLGGVLVLVDAVNNVGILTLSGPVDRFSIGGQELFLDDFVFDRIQRLPRDIPCPPGMRVQIPAGALVDEGGNPPPGNVSVSVGTYDILAPDGLPGDYTAEDMVGDVRVMESFGAGAIEIYDAATSYNLRPGAVATLTMPVAPIHLLYARPIPPVIPNLVYNRETGIWEEIGVWNLVGAEYVTQVSHLSEFNTDLVKTNQACVKIDSSSLPASYRLEVTIPQGTDAAPKVVSGDVDNAVPFHVVYNLPTNTDITLVAIRADDDVPIGSVVVNTGGPQNPTDPNRPDYPYDACQSTATLYDPELSDPPSLSQSPATSFLHGLTSFAATAFSEYSGSTPATGAIAEAFAQATADYYEIIDPHDRRATLTGFINTNGFTPTNTVHAVFANSGDLGFGRDMYCTRTEEPSGSGNYDVACYVTNYGTGYQPLLGDGTGGGYGTDDDVDFANAVNGVGPIATVAMEYSRIEDPADTDPSDGFDFLSNTRVVKFYVYVGETLRDGTDGLGNVDVTNAFVDLDGFGGRPLPELCIVCHGGTLNYDGIPSDANPPVFDPANGIDDVNMGSVFLPFDLAGFTIDDSVNPAFTKANQQAEFRQLNQEIVLSSNPGAPIEELIDYLYPPVGGLGAGNQDEDAVVDGWDDEAAQEAMYLNVVRPACRTCHVGQVNAFGPTFQTAAQAQAFAGPIRSQVCVNGVMPHARRTYDNFWLSINPHQPAQLVAWGSVYAAGLDWSACETAPEDAAPVTEQVYYYPTIQDIVDNQGCNNAICHSGGGAPYGLNLDPLPNNAYNLLVNIVSGELGSMDRIEPGDPNDSYLWHKVNNTQGSVGGIGSGMPPPSGIADATDLQLIENWILFGAPDEE